VGDRHVIQALHAGNYSFGGEDSGHLVFMDHATTGDGILSALQLLRILKESGRSLQELTSFVEIYPHRLVNVKVAEKRPLDQIPRLQAELDACAAALGNQGRHLVRYSGTENKIRVLIEARNQTDVDTWIER